MNYDDYWKVKGNNVQCLFFFPLEIEYWRAVYRAKNVYVAYQNKSNKLMHIKLAMPIACFAMLPYPFMSNFRIEYTANKLHIYSVLMSDVFSGESECIRISPALRYRKMHTNTYSFIETMQLICMEKYSRKLFIEKINCWLLFNTSRWNSLYLSASKQMWIDDWK